MKVALLGFGTVGSSFYSLSQNHKDIQISVVLSQRPRELSCQVTDDIDQIIRDPAVQIVVEAIGGLHPAYEYVCAAMRAGKHVVTANKYLMVAYYDKLLSLARQCGVCLRCTAAAAGGIPWLTAVSRAARLDDVTAVEGILNGTTNHMLDVMTNQGTDYSDALRQAQEMGLAEADPASDTEGMDSLQKLILSLNIAFGVSAKEAEIPRLGISGILPEDIAFFRAQGLVCKLFTRAERREGKLAAFVIPTLFTPSAFQLHTNVSLYAKRLGRQSFTGVGSGPRPSGFPTGSSVLADCIDIADGCNTFYHISDSGPYFVDNSIVLSKFYYRIKDQKGFTEPMPVDEAFRWIDHVKSSRESAFFARLYE